MRRQKTSVNWHIVPNAEEFQPSGQRKKNSGLPAPTHHAAMQ
jgi:hypothetical protein